MSRITKEGNLDPAQIPGVSRGFPPKGVPFDLATDLGARRLKESLPQREADLYIIDAESASYLKLPKLTPEGLNVLMPSWVPRYDRVTGAVYTTRWHDSDLENAEITDGRIKKDDTVYFPLGGRGVGKMSINGKIPVSWQVKQLVPQQIWGGVEAAMRQQNELMHDYGVDIGPEVEQTKMLISRIGQLNDFFKSSELTNETFSEIGRELAATLSEFGLTNARDAVKQKTIQKLLGVPLHDKLGRLNPTAARLKLRSALFDAIELQVTSGLINDKSNRVYSFLLVEREMTRLSLADAQRLMRNMGGFKGGVGSQIFNDSKYLENPENLPENLINSTSKTLEYASSTLLRRARVAPFLIPARAAEVMLTGVEKKDEEKFREILSYGGVEQVIEEPSVELLLRQRRPAEATKRLRSACELLSNLLDDPDRQAYPAF